MSKNVECVPARSSAKADSPTRSERMKAVPGLIELASDPKTEEQTRAWLYQALREITGQRFTNHPDAWRLWYEKHGQETMLKFAAAEQVPPARPSKM
jgi:hypothetical protein